MSYHVHFRGPGRHASDTRHANTCSLAERAGSLALRHLTLACDSWIWRTSALRDLMSVADLFQT
jgi:hypothetical protein